MPIYNYECECGKVEEISKSFKDFERVELCSCGRIMSRVFDASSVNVLGTKDQFGFNNQFYDPQTRQTIDTRKKWEQAGFREAGQTKDRRDSNHQNKVKEKTKKQLFKQGKRRSYGT